MKIGPAQIQRQERGLSLPERHLRSAGLKHMLRMSGRESKRRATIHDILTQTKCYLGLTFLWKFVAQRIEIQAPGNTREGGIEPPGQTYHIRIGAFTALLPYHFLNYHGHFLLVNHILRGLHIRLGFAVEHTGIHRFHSFCQVLQRLLRLLRIMWYHVGRVDACKGLILRVFQQR